VRQSLLDNGQDAPNGGLLWEVLLEAFVAPGVGDCVAYLGIERLLR